jgi:uncharacterized SAM-binding protein YcdF (DUF218 family)
MTEDCADGGIEQRPGPALWRRTPVRIAMAAFLVLILALLVWIPGSIWFFAMRDETRPADAAIVLGAAVWTNRPSPVFHERISHGIALHQNGTVKALLFTGGLAPGDDIAESEAARNIAIIHGVEPSHILTETSSTTTWENLYYARRLLDKAGMKTVLIVSDPMHMKRAVTMARDLGLDAHASPTPTSLYTSFSSKVRFLWNESRHLVTHRIARMFGYR